MCGRSSVAWSTRTRVAGSRFGEIGGDLGRLGEIGGEIPLLGTGASTQESKTRSSGCRGRPNLGAISVRSLGAISVRSRCDLGAISAGCPDRRNLVRRRPVSISLDLAQSRCDLATSPVLKSTFGWKIGVTKVTCSAPIKNEERMNRRAREGKGGETSPHTHSGGARARRPSHLSRMAQRLP